MKNARYILLLPLFAVGACTNSQQAMLDTPPRNLVAAAPKVVDVMTTEFQFDMPDSVPAGPTVFHLINKGHQLHHVTLVKLDRGKTLADFTALPPGPPPAWAEFVGGPNTPLPNGGQDDVIVDLSPGHYAVICVIPDVDGKPHMMKGMTKALTVTPTTPSQTALVSDLTLTLTNYAFTFSARPTAGRHAIRVVNHGNQIHEAVMFRMAPGMRGEDIADWVANGMQGPPPGAPVAGITAEAPGRENILLLDLAAGDYALLCFIPDAMDGKAHAAHGMILNFKVT